MKEWTPIKLTELGMSLFIRGKLNTVSADGKTVKIRVSTMEFNMMNSRKPRLNFLDADGDAIAYLVSPRLEHGQTVTVGGPGIEILLPFTLKQQGDEGGENANLSK